ncbi:MAG: outer membrane lipoprotein-sorting protein [Armatimonadetes bacterium]|nr:outer membrane lipoprotein-sorting protein [Armatimonadota bacterium]
MQRSLLAFYYGGSDTKIRARMDLIDRSGGRRTRVLTMLRRDESEGANQRLFIYFHEPSDVRGVSLLVWKYPAKDDDRWIYMPAMDLERRVSANDRQSSFVGSDFTYEDVSGRDLGDERHRLVGEGSAGGRACYQIESTPVGASSYARRVWWIDKQNYLPLKEEYYDRRGGLVRVFSADEVRSIATGSHTYPTVTKRTMKDVRTGRRTEVTFTDVKYDLGLRAADFTERSLRRPPAAWIR